MKDISEENIIHGYDDDNYSELDESLFEFKYKDIPECLNGKGSTLVSLLILIVFIPSFFERFANIKIELRLIAAGLCLIFFFLQRYVYLYKRAERHSHRVKRYPVMIKCMRIFVNSKKFFKEGMPAAYYLIKERSNGKANP